jgi:HAMP domain-containing protein
MIKLKDLKIGMQLKIGLAVVYALVLLLGGMAWFQADSLWNQTKGLYDHPLQVSRSAREIKLNIALMSRGMKELMLTGSDSEREEIIQGINTIEAYVNREFENLFNRYLGPRKDVDEAYTAFRRYVSIIGETIRLLRQGNVTEAKNRIKSAGVGSRKAEMVLQQIQDVLDFQEKRGAKFYLDSLKHKDELSLGLAIMLGAILMILGGAGYFMLGSIRDPLTELTSVTDQYQRGNLDARSRYESANEIGHLANAFNALLDTVRMEMRVNQSAGKIAAVMLREEELRSFCRELLKALLEHTGSQVGAVYLLNARGSEFEHYESIGLSAAGHASFSALGHEGEFGAALAAHEIRRIRDIPADTRFTFSAVTGDLPPREIITIPILSGRDVGAMISLANVRNYDDSAIRILNDVWSVMTARLNGVLAFRKVLEFSEKLESQNQDWSSRRENCRYRRMN